MPGPAGCDVFPGSEYADVRAGQRIPAFSEYADRRTGRRTARRPSSPREDGTEVPVGRGAVPNPIVNPTIIPSRVPISFPSPRGDATEVPVGRGAVPKTGQKPPSPRRNATGVPVGMVLVPKTGQKTPFTTR